MTRNYSADSRTDGAGPGRRGSGMAIDSSSYVDPDLATRTSLVDAHIAYVQVARGRATGNKCALWLRWQLQQRLFDVGCFIQIHAGKVLFLGVLLLSLCCVGLKTASLETSVENLWVEEGGRLSRELAYTLKWLGEGSGTTYEMIVQVPQSAAVSGDVAGGSMVGGSSNVLSVRSMLQHLDAVRAATKLSVNVFDVTWNFRELCYAVTFPNFDDDGTINQILTNLEPCVIITPLDCFWEGSKLLGPEYGVYIPGYNIDVKWSNLNPQDIISSLHNLGVRYGDEAEELLKNAPKVRERVKSVEGNEMVTMVTLREPSACKVAKAGITTGYQEKPCLNPTDPECPQLAPNHHAKQVPDVKAAVTGGCDGISAKYLHWEEDLIVGGTYHGKSGQLMSAKAMQTLIQLMGEKDLYDYYRDTYKVHGIDWTLEKARLVLDTWRRQFTQAVLSTQNSSDPLADQVYAMSSLDLVDVMDEFSQLSILRVVVGCLIICVYSSLALVNLSDAVQSQATVGLAGVLLVILSVSAGLGICSVVGIRFNAATTQILPFLAVGLGVDDVFLIAHTFKLHAYKPNIDYLSQTGECLKRIGLTVLTTSLCNSCAFFVASIIPIPAMRAFCLQSAVLILFNLATVLLVYPAVISLDLVRRKRNKIDFFCCFTWSSMSDVEQGILTVPSVASANGGQDAVSYTRPSTAQRDVNAVSTSGRRSSRLARDVVAVSELDGSHPVSVLAQNSPQNSVSSVMVVPTLSAASSNQYLANSVPDLSSYECCSTVGCSQMSSKLRRASLTRFARDVYSPLLQNTVVKVIIICITFLLLIAAAVGIDRIREGLDITDIVPRGTHEHQFLETQSQFFGFYNFYAVTKSDFDYTAEENQKLLHAFHQSFIKIDNIIKKEDGSLPNFWLHDFRSWLSTIQDAFDQDVKNGCIFREGWSVNATVEGRLGYKLIVQTGEPDNPIDTRRFNYGRLVNAAGTVYGPAFYTYLSAWASNDAMAYSSSMAALRPQPKEWFHDENDRDVKIPKSQPLAYAQSAFYLHDLGNTDNITATMKEIRDICDMFTSQGLPNYPQGVIFTFWEQYMNLRFYLMLALIAVLAAIFVILSILLLNPWAAFVVVLVLGVIVVELFGMMGLLGVKLSAIPAVILIITAGIGVEFTVYVCISFITAIGSTRNKRLSRTLEPVFAPVVHGAVSTLLGLVMLAGSQFDFIVRYFFVILSLLVALGLLNGLAFLPVLLSIIGPPAEVVPLNNADEMPMPSPQPPPKRDKPQRRKRAHGRRVVYNVRRDELSTIAEESSQHRSSFIPPDSSSISVDLQPEVVVVETRSPSPPSPVGYQSTPPPPYSGTASLPSAVAGCCNCSTARHFHGVPATVTSTSSSSSSAGHRVTTIRTTARVKVEVTTPMPCMSRSPDFKSKRRKHARIEKTYPINYDLDSSTES